MNDLELIKEMKVKLLKKATKPKSDEAGWQTGQSASRTKPGRTITDPGKISTAMKIKKIAATFKKFFSGGEEGTQKHSKLAAKLASQNVLFKSATAPKKKKTVKAEDLASKNVLFKKRK